MLLNKHPIRSLKAGFTIIEMLIIAPIVILTIGAFVSVIVSMTGEVLATRSSNVLAYDIKDALNRIEADIKLSTTFLATNTVTPLTTPQGYDDATTAFANVDAGTKGDMLILNTLATINNPLSSGASLVYLTNQPNACNSTLLTQNKPMTMNVIYFVKNNTLWRRSVMPANYLTAGCAVPWQQPSCAPTAAGAFCQTKDIRLIDGINASDFNVQYFDAPSSVSANVTASDSAALPAVRTAALEPATTVNVAINVTKTAAGRDISQDGSIKATKLDTNASAIAAVVAPPVPIAPVVSAAISEPTTAIFTWPQVNAATTYTVNCSINGGVYTTCASNLTTPTYSNSSAIRNQSVCVTVYAINSSGTSPFGAKCITVPAWNALFMQNGWSDYNNNYTSAAYTKTSDGLVVLKGLIKRVGAAVSNEVIAVLPVGYRPAEQLIFQTSSNQDASRIDVWQDGTIRVVVGSAPWASLDAINFLPSAAPYVFNALTPLLNSWAIYGSPPWATPAYVIDVSGRVHLKGLVRSGVTTDSTPIVALPTAARPSGYEHIAVDNSNGNGQIGIDPAGAIVAKGGSNAFLSLQAMYYPSAYAGWTGLTLQGGWLYYGAPYSAPRYTKSADGMVVVKGLLRAGATTPGTIIANLPVGYRPKGRLLMAITATGAWGRVDILPNGDIEVSAITNPWASLDSITFMAEQ